MQKKFVVLITIPTSVSFTKDQRVEPNAHTFYDDIKVEVDVVDLSSTLYNQNEESVNQSIRLF